MSKRHETSLYIAVCPKTNKLLKRSLTLLVLRKWKLKPRVNHIPTPHKRLKQKKINAREEKKIL